MPDGNGAARKRTGSTPRACGRRSSPRATKATAAPSDTRAVVQPFSDVYASYLRALQDAWTNEELQERAAEAYQDYLEVLDDREEALTAHRRAVDAYEVYSRSLQGDGDPLEVQRGAADAYGTMIEVLREAPARMERKASDALGAYMDLVRAGPAVVGEQFEAAYRGYVADLRRAWSETDPDAVDLTALAAITQTMANAVNTHGACALAMSQAGVQVPAGASPGPAKPAPA